MSLDNEQLKELRHFIDDKMFEYLKADNLDARSALGKVLDKITELEQGVSRKK